MQKQISTSGVALMIFKLLFKSASPEELIQINAYRKESPSNEACFRALTTASSLQEKMKLFQEIADGEKDRLLRFQEKLRGTKK